MSVLFNGLKDDNMKLVSEIKRITDENQDLQ